MTDAITEWASTAGLIGLVFGFLVVLGRHAVPATRRPRLSSLRVRGVLLTAHAGSRHLAQLHARAALPPWDDLGRHFPLHRRELPPRTPGGECG